MTFKTNWLYSMPEIEEKAGQLSTYNEHHNLYSVRDVNHDYSQYDFRSSGKGYLLVAVDGHPLSGKP